MTAAHCTSDHLTQAGTDAALAALPAPLSAWFVARVGTPTAAQRLAWPAIAAGRHLLLSAPTGTGKTLAAFLPLLGRLLADPPAATASSPWRLSGGLRGLYVAPLKALVADAARNLTAHVDDLSPFLPPATPRPRLAVRTGDSSAAERRLLRAEPPDVLLTTPESLAVLLSQPTAADLFARLEWIVVDEVHALVGCKRGADLAVGLERLERLAETVPQRVGLSATATPPDVAARWLAGADRPCAIAVAASPSPLYLTIAPLDESNVRFLAAVIEHLLPAVRNSAAVLVFVNARSLAERLAWALRRAAPDLDGQIAVHHSSLAAERRRAVEEDFKAGRLRAVVGSSSLELGIDVGAVDLVVLIHPPGDVIRLLQRVGRAGHGPGRERRGLVLTASASELLEAAVTAASGLADQCEPLTVPACPLDVLCQQIVGMAAAGPCAADAVFDLVRRAAPFAGLARRDFDDCLAYLLGLDRDGTAWLPGRLRGDAHEFRIADAATARLLRRNLGTILEEPRCDVRLLDDPASGGREPPDDDAPSGGSRPPLAEGLLIGTLDETFAERLQPGDRFLLDGRCLQVRRQSATAVGVEEGPGRPAPPRWGGDGWPLSPQLARRLYVLRVQAAEALRDGPDALAALLRRDFGLDGRAVALLAAYFEGQETLSEIPDADTCLIEAVPFDDGETWYVHTPLGRKANDALARVAVQRLVRDQGRAAGSVIADLGFALRLRGGPLAAAPPDLLRRLLAADGFDADLDAALASGDVIRRRFGRLAVTGLMLLRNPLGRRRRVGGADWGERRLFEQVRGRDPDFVLLRQAVREVRSELCDADAARNYAVELPARTVRCRRLARPSPFAENWTQLDVGPVEEVGTPADALRRLHAVLTGQGDTVS